MLPRTNPLVNPGGGRCLFLASSPSGKEWKGHIYSTYSHNKSKINSAAHTRMYWYAGTNQGAISLESLLGGSEVRRLLIQGVGMCGVQLQMQMQIFCS
jgi:hypothetical protein